jgi:hypothetical protein
MTFLEQLQAHKGGLIQLKSQLYWYGGRGYDGNPGRVCLILDAASAAPAAPAPAAAARACQVAAAVAYLLLDGSPQWVWVAKEDMELL